MPTRIYDASLLDVQMAPASLQSATGGAVWNKSMIGTDLSKIMDAKTYASVPETFVPLALRWRCSTDLGMPFTPFKVYKRKKSLPFAETSVAMSSLPDRYVILNGPYWQVSLVLKNNSLFQSNIGIVPIDQNQEPIPGQEIKQTLPASGTVNLRFKFPNIFGFIITAGPGVIQSPTGIRMEDFLNDKDWMLTETVGFPYKTGKPDPTAYQNAPQGFPTAPVDGYQAGINRLAIAKLVAQQPTLLQADGTLLPPWTIPVPTVLIDSFHKTQSTLDSQQTGILFDIEEMLKKVHNFPSLYEGRQKNYFKQFKTSGFSDSGSGTSDSAMVKNPVCGTTLLGVASDCWNAVGLGFGCTDLAALIAGMAGGVGSIDSEYMVTATFRMPQFKSTWLPFESVSKFDHLENFEVASLAYFADAINPLTGIGNEIFAENRPTAMDQRFSDAVKIYWDRPDAKLAFGYAIAIKDTLTNTLGYLNANRPFLAEKRPYLPAVQADKTADDLPGNDAVNKNRFFHHRSERSDAGSVQKNYYVAATDVFGRWTAFQKTVSTLAKAPQVTAEIISGKFILDKNQASGHIFSGSVLELIIAWHWSDRSPYEINIGGHFQAVPVPPAQLDLNSVAKTTGIKLANALATNIDLSIGFNGTVPFVRKIVGGPPYPAASSLEAEVVIDTTNSAPPGLIAYKIRIKNFQLNFENGSKLAYAAYVRSSVNLAPAAFTVYGTPKMIYALDPLPRIAPTLLPNINWASLPDATNVARYRVDFDLVTGAVGYALYRATEASLREKAGLPDISPDQSILDRRAELFQLTSGVKAQAKDAFIRLNRELITTDYADVELPGDLDGMYIYTLTSFTDQRVESDFSGWLYVGVPRRHTPPAPVLTAFTWKNGPQRDVRLRLEIPPGTPTEKLELFSTGKEYLASSLNLMGPAVASASVSALPAGWIAFDENGAQIQLPNPNKTVAYFEYTQTLAPQWTPLHFRAASWGSKSDSTGKYPGRSGSSNLVSIQMAPPEDAPVLKNLILVPVSPTVWRIEFLSNVVLGNTEFGQFTVRVQKRNVATNVYEDVMLKNVPEVPRLNAGDSPVTGTLYRSSGKDGMGCYEFEHYVTADAEAWYQVIVTDPMGRSSATKVYYKKPVVLLKNLVVNVLAQSVEVSFAINANNKVPPYGHYFMSILAQKAPTLQQPNPAPVVLYSANLDAIGTAIPLSNPAVYMNAHGSQDGFFTYYAAFKGLSAINAFKDAITIVRITDPNGKKYEFNNAPRA